MSGGGGKGGSETTETTIPDWLKQPAIRNLQRAEDVQRIEYMPYYGGDVAAFTPTQNVAFDANIGAGEAFGLLAPGHGLTATSGMPTPTDFDGFTGYSSQPMYESALAELKAKQPGAVAQYNALFGANVPTQRNYGGGGGGRFRGSASPGSPPGSPPRNIPLNMPQANIDAMVRQLDRIDEERHGGEAEGRNYWGATTVADDTSPFTTDYPARTPVYSSRLDSKGYTPQTYKPLDEQMQKKK